MSSKREREYARRRYEDWEKRQSEKAQRSVRNQRAIIAAAAGLVVVVIAAIWLISALNDGDDAAPAAAEDPGNPCPTPTVSAPAEPKQWDKVPPKKADQFLVTLKTSCGDIVLALDGKKAPQGVGATVFLAQEGFFDGVSCHRLTANIGTSVLQCGDPTGTGRGGPGFYYGPIENAPKDDFYPAGTVAMARVGGDAKSMGSQFFLVYEDSDIPSDDAGGYTVLGQISKGLDVVRQIAEGGVEGGGSDGKPARPISIESTEVIQRDTQG